MTPSLRRNGILAGLALSSLCALGFAQQSRNDWALKWQSESEVREARESELDAAKRERGTELDAMQRRVALLESDLAREREAREAAEGRAATATRPVAELEASKAELERAYLRIRALEATEAAALLGKPTIRDCENVGLIEDPVEVQVAEGTEGEAEDNSTRKIRCANARLGTIIIERRCKTTESAQLLPQEFANDLNQGAGYVEPLPPGDGSQILGEGLNQGTNYVDPEGEQNGKTVQEKLEAIKSLVEELKCCQKEQDPPARK